jgi:hypothetical protein
MKALRMCLNWKVLSGLATVGIGVYALAPGLVAEVLPILLLAACPLSMLLMVVGMREGQGNDSRQRVSQGAEADLTREEQMARLRAQQAGATGDPRRPHRCSRG